MSQQTQVDRVIPKWTEFLEKWPTPSDCATASLGDVLRVWQGLGYPRRAKNLHAAAGVVAALPGGFPTDLEGLLALPGVGPYTARAVLAFAFGADVAVVDTNAARVLARWANTTLTAKQVQQHADAYVPPGEGWAWNQAILDLGATLCTARGPQCVRCPVSAWCAWNGEGDDPAIGSAGVSGKQAPFAGSDRQARGRLLRAAGRQPFRRSEAPSVASLEHDVARSLRLVQSLIDDGLVVVVNDVVQLPDV